MVFLFHDAGADAEYSVCTLLSSSINKNLVEAGSFLFCTQSHQRQWLAWDHGYADATAAMLLLLLLRMHLSRLPCIEYALMQRKNKEKGPKEENDEVCVGTASIRLRISATNGSSKTPSRGTSAGDSLVS